MNVVANRVRGTQDILDLKVYNRLIALFEKHAHLYHFEPVLVPIIEHTSLFKRSLGQHTDVVSKEMFIIKGHNEEEDELCLRPEMTASITRAFLEANIDLLPWSVYSIGSCFRYERPQKGRYRQFNQISLEIMGAESITHDVTLITLLERFFFEVLKLNTYILQLNFLGCAQDRVRFKEKLAQFLDKHSGEICATCLERRHANILRVFDCKNEQCQKLYNTAPVMTDHLCTTCAHEWNTLQEQLQLLSISFVINNRLVRGLDYYNKTVFEFTSANLGAQSAFCGGGRYELASVLGGKELPSVGAAIGIERLFMLVEEQKAIEVHEQALLAIVPVTKEQISLALFIADELRAHNLATELVLDRDSVKAGLRYVNKIGAKYALMVGPDEQANRTVQVKNMVTGAQETIPQSKLIEYFSK